VGEREKADMEPKNSVSSTLTQAIIRAVRSPKMQGQPPTSQRSRSVNVPPGFLTKIFEGFSFERLSTG
jgi:hypothetical protein